MVLFYRPFVCGLFKNCLRNINIENLVFVDKDRLCFISAQTVFPDKLILTSFALPYHDYCRDGHNRDADDPRPHILPLLHLKFDWRM